MSRRAVVLVLAAASWACGGRGGLPPTLPPKVKGPDGKEYLLVEKGPYKAYYDRFGRLERIDYDSNGDGRADHIAHHHDGSKTPELIEVDENFDGIVDRWETYDSAGNLVKVGSSRRGKGPDVWVFPGPGGLPVRREYDEDGDGLVDRAEVLKAGVVVAVELDTDRDGKMDRWQQWAGGALVSEELDTDHDGKPDRRLRYDQRGAVTRLEPIVR